MEATRKEPMSTSQIAYTVGAMRAAGLEARWTKNRSGRPMIVVRDPQAQTKHQREDWWICDKEMFRLMGKDGVREGFDNATLFGNLFSI